MNTHKPQVLVTQMGARMHYAVPEILERNGSLSSFHTDIVAFKSGSAFFRNRFGRSSLAKRFLGRTISEALRKKTYQHPMLGLWYMMRLKRAKTLAQRRAVFRDQAQALTSVVANSNLTGVDATYSFTSAGLELLEVGRSFGVHGFLEQFIGSQRALDSVLLQERKRFGLWETNSSQNVKVPGYFERIEKEWELADTIICPSQFVANSLAKEGVDKSKIAIVPYGVKPNNCDKKNPKIEKNRPLRILFVGTVELRKGVHYLQDALARLSPSSYEARVVGNVRITAYGKAKLSEVAEIVGPIPRSEITREFAWADVFVLPSLFEGSATVTYEALASGVPVICTANTGSIVQNGINGQIIDAYSSDAILEALMNLIDDPSLLCDMQEATKSNFSEATTDRYERDLLRTLDERLSF